MDQNKDLLSYLLLYLMVCMFFNIFIVENILENIKQEDTHTQGKKQKGLLEEGIKLFKWEELRIEIS